jgi:hypothetical protein
MCLPSCLPDGVGEARDRQEDEPLYNYEADPLIYNIFKVPAGS